MISLEGSTGKDFFQTYVTVDRIQLLRGCQMSMHASFLLDVAWRLPLFLTTWTYTDGSLLHQTMKAKKAIEESASRIDLPPYVN
jgi:hypothetical protein